MSQPDVADSLTNGYGHIIISGQGQGHLGDTYKYGDVFNVGEIKHATFQVFQSAPDHLLSSSGINTTIAFVQCAGSALSLGQSILDRVRLSTQSDPALTNALRRFENQWITIEAHIQEIIVDIAPRTQSENIDRLLTCQKTSIETLVLKLTAFAQSLAQPVPLEALASTKVDDRDIDVSKDSNDRLRWLSNIISRGCLDLEKWYPVFSSSYTLLARLANEEAQTHLVNNLATPHHEKMNHTIMKQLRRFVHQPNNIRKSSIPLVSKEDYKTVSPLSPNTTTAWIGKSSLNGKTVILSDTAYFRTTNLNAVYETVREMAKLLSIEHQPFAGLLRCIAIARLQSSNFRYVLALPDGCQQLNSLRSLLSSPEPSLTQKVAYSRTLGRAVMTLHNANYVHKCIRPDNILVDPNCQTQSICSQCFLIGFEQLRPRYGHSGLIADMNWCNNIYRHPARQGIRLQEYYVMQHDIYSFGVCLLEIMLWDNFVRFNNEEGSKEAIPSPTLEIEDCLQMRNKAEAARKIQQRLIHLAKTQLPSKAGDMITEVVLSCLTCLDKGASNMFEQGDDLYDEDGLLIGVAFIDKVLVKLEQIMI